MEMKFINNFMRYTRKLIKTNNVNILMVKQVLF